MPYMRYEDWKPRRASLMMVARAQQLSNEYKEMGYSLTLRQLYYRFIATDAFPDERKWTWTGSRWVRDPNGTKNAEPNYKWLGDLVSKARMAGMLDWDLFIDRTRQVKIPNAWSSPESILRGSEQQYAEDLWAGQQRRIEVWVEKDALVDVVGRASSEMNVPYFSCRGYTSQSAMWRAGQRLVDYMMDGQRPTIIHLGDHDPSGIDMSRDIFDRLSLFIGSDPRVWGLAAEKGCETPWEYAEEFYEDLGDGEDPEWSTPYFGVQRIALNMDQIEELNPPPSPAKMTDSRYGEYVRQFGDDSWELDALEPQDLDRLITDSVFQIRDDEIYNEKLDQQEENRQRISDAVDWMRSPDRWYEEETERRKEAKDGTV